MNTVRIARDFGTVAELLPEGWDLRDCPHVYFDAIRQALVVLSFDELDENERPPKRIWNDGEALSEWFKDVRRRRDEKYGAGKNGPGEIEDPVQNDAAKLLVAG